jgi:hypothetical protein
MYKIESLSQINMFGNHFTEQRKIKENVIGKGKVRGEAGKEISTDAATLFYRGRRSSPNSSSPQSSSPLFPLAAIRDRRIS